MILRIDRGNYLVGLWVSMVLLVFLGCEQRFGAYQVINADSEETSLVRNLDFLGNVDENFPLDKAVNWFLIQEKMNWKSAKQSEVTTLVNQNPASINVHLYAASYFLAIDSLTRALMLNQRAEQLGAQSIYFYKTRSQICSALGEYDLAIDYINKAVMLNSNDSEIYLSKGDIYLRLGDSLSALSYKEQAYRQDSSRLDVANELAYLYVASAWYGKAESLINYLQTVDTTLVELDYLFVRIKMQKGDLDAANQMRKEMLSKGKIRAGLELLEYYNRMDEQDSVIEVSTQILALDSANIVALNLKAVVFDRKGYYSSALMYYGQVLAIDSLHKEAIEGVIKIKGKIAYLRKIKEQREAIPSFDFSGSTKKTIN